MTRISPPSRAVALLAASLLTLLTIGVGASTLDPASPARAETAQPTVTLSPSSGLLTDTTVQTTTDLVCPPASGPRAWPGYYVYLTTTAVTARATFATDTILFKTSGFDPGITQLHSAVTAPVDGAFPVQSTFPAGNADTGGLWQSLPDFLSSEGKAPLADTLTAGDYSLVMMCVTQGKFDKPITVEDLGGGSFGAYMAWTHITVEAGGAWHVVAAPVSAETSTGLTAIVNGNSTATMTATVTASDAPVGSGTVEFYEGSTKLGEQAVSGAGVAAYTTEAALSAGSHSFTAKYVPAGTDYLPSTSAQATVTVEGPVAATTVTALTAALATANTATLTASVKSNGVNLDAGTVKFFDGATSLGEKPVSGGTATLTTSTLSVGDHPFTATYVPASSAYAASTSPEQSLTVSAEQTDGTSVAIAAVWGVTTTGDPVVGLGAAILQDGVAEPTAAGTVQFFRNAVKLGDPVEVENGQAVTSDTKSGGLAFDTKFDYRAEFTPASTSDLDAAVSDTVSVTIPKVVQLTSGATATAGSAYYVTVPDGTFGNGEAVTGEVRSTPIPVGSATATTAGGLGFAFKMPSGLAPGAHSLVLTGSTGTTHTVAFSIAAGSSNSPASFATEWAAQLSSNPTTLLVLFAALLVLSALGVLGWNMFWRRRKTPTASE